jgi:hypothetical protein
MNWNIEEHYSPAQIEYLDEQGTKAELKSFMKIWAQVNNPPAHWTSLAQDIYSGETKPRWPKPKQPRNEIICTEIQMLIDSGEAPVPAHAIEMVANKRNMDSDSIRKRIWDKRDKEYIKALATIATLQKQDFFINN